MSELFADTFEIMLAGMGGVFVFLIVLTFAVGLLTKLFPEIAVAKTDETQSASKNLPESETPSKASSAAKLAAVTVAVQKYRQARGSAADPQE
ncbi:sodium pump decarboxylase gamma subunit family protein [Idiomarina sp. A28L]|uniref:OadG family protein n=1 Tax=Idiomarina sp. A28L TaxID=1036674 RepID=UPI0002138BDC|nr:OadG family transporter subunit [Idiomarina sp. A28L]EGN74356.1 sodium pump decarboxylase gamma subunit family protein [Idiomarina sp. A28L]